MMLDKGQTFRHTFTDACRNAGVEYPVTQALLGHTPSGITGQYGAGYGVPFLKRSIEQVAIPFDAKPPSSV